LTTLHDIMNHIYYAWAYSENYTIGEYMCVLALEYAERGEI